MAKHQFSCVQGYVVEVPASRMVSRNMLTNETVAICPVPAARFERKVGEKAVTRTKDEFDKLVADTDHWRLDGELKGGKLIPVASPGRNEGGIGVGNAGEVHGWT